MELESGSVGAGPTCLVNHRFRASLSGLVGRERKIKRREIRVKSEGILGKKVLFFIDWIWLIIRLEISFKIANWSMGMGLLRRFEMKEKERVVVYLSAGNVNNFALKTFTIMLPTISASINGTQIFFSSLSLHFNYSYSQKKINICFSHLNASHVLQKLSASISSLKITLYF